MNTTQADEAHRRHYVLCEFHRALVWAKLAQVDIETAMLALDRNLVSAEDAVAMVWESSAVRLFGLDFSSGSQAVRIGPYRHEVQA